MGLSLCIGIVIFFVILFILTRSDDFEWIMVLPVALIACIITMIFVVIPIATFQKPQIVETEINNIASIKGDSRLKGSWILFNGSINEIDYYFFYEEQTNGGFIERKIVKENTIIFQEDGQPRVEKDVVEVETSFMTIGTTSKYEYRLYVPKGTITERFEL